MAIILGPGEKFEPKDPMGLYRESNAAPLKQAAAEPVAGLAGDDWNALVNTVIAEAGGEGPDGLAAVAHVIRNRATASGKSPAEIVRAPSQFEGYSAPGAGSRKAMEDPEARSRAEQIIRGVFSGEMPDPTGGADHFHADYVSPSWAASMPRTTKIGGHTFYRAGTFPGAGGGRSGGGGDPEARGMARLAPKAEEPRQGAGGNITFRNPGQDRLQPMLMNALTEVSLDLGRDLTITSGYRSPKHPVEARKKSGPGQHARGSAADIDMRGMSEAQRATLVQELQARGVKRFGLYSNSPDMLHVDLKDQSGNGDPWFMFDRTNRKMGKAPAWFRAMSQQRTPVKRGDTIIADENYRPADPMGLYRGGSSPLSPAAPAENPSPVDAQPAAIQADPQQPNPLEDTVRTLNEQDPDRYQLIDEEGFEDWRREWEAAQPGMMEDIGRLFGGSVVEGVGHIVRGIGAAGAAVARPTVDNIVNPIFGTEYDLDNPLGSAADAVGEYGAQIKDGVSVATQRAISDSSPDGDLLEPSTWTFGEQPSLRGYTALSLDVLGSLTPVLAAAVVGGPVAGMAVGGAQGGGAAEQEAHDLVDLMAEKGVLEQESAYYRQLLAEGATPEVALDKTRQAAGRVAFLLTAPISALGGAATAKIIDPATLVLEGRNIVLRTAGRGGLGALEEGTQEAAEQVATRTGVNIGAEASLNTTEGTFGDFVLGALGGVAPGAAAGAMSPRQQPDEPLPPVDAAPEPTRPTAPPTVQEPKGPLSRALQAGERHAAERAGGTFTVNDPDIDGTGPGQAHGQQVRVAPDQSGVQDGMRRVVLPDGQETLMGESLLVPDAPAATPAGPGGPAGAPAIGSTVQVQAEGIDPFMARVEGFEGDEVVLFDSGTGEIYQVPLSQVSQIADAPQSAPAPAPAPERPVPTVITRGMRANLKDLGWSDDQVRQMSPAEADGILREGRNPETAPVDPDDPALEPQPQAGVEQVDELPPRSEQRPASERFPGPPPPGTRVIVDAEGVERFAGRIESYEGDEAIVVDDAGTPMQVPLDALYISNVTKKEAEAAELKRNPPVEREKATGPEAREVLGKQIAMPDDRHARLYDLGKLRRDSKKTLGAGQLDLDSVSSAEQRRLAQEFGVSERALGQIADDYRYRVERAAKSARTQTPQKVPQVHPSLLKRMEAEDRRAGTTSPAAPIDEAARDAATSPENALPEPTQAQKEAGNYKKGHVRLGGLDLSIENPAGSTRSGKSRSGRDWSVTMKSHYGYIKGTVGRDKDHIDVFVRPGVDAIDDAAPVFVVDQRDPARRRFDEHKVMLGFEDEASARRAYLDNYSKGWKGLGDITPATLGEFKSWLAAGDTKQPFAKRSARTGTVPVSEPAPAPAPAVDSNAERFRAIDEGFAQNRAALPNFKKGDAVEFTHRDFYREPVDGSRDRIFTGTMVKVSNKEQGVIEVRGDGGQTTFVEARRLRKRPEADKAPPATDTPAPKADPGPRKGDTSPKSGMTKPVTLPSRDDRLAALYEELAEKTTPKRLIEDVARSASSQIAAIVDPDGGLWTLKASTNPAGEHAEFFGQLAERDLAPGEQNGYVRVTGYTNQIGASSHGPVSDAQRSMLRALRTAAERAGLNYIGEGAANQNGNPSREKRPEAVNTKKQVEAKLAEWGAENKLVSRDRASELRRRLKDKLNQVGAGIDPEILAIGTELAAFHIEAGARRFAAFARAIADDLGQPLESLRPYLRAWYNGARDMMEDSGISITDMDDADAVRAELARMDAAEETTDEPAELDRAGPGALERAPAEAVRPARESRDAGRRADRSGQSDLFGGEPARGERIQLGRGVADGEGGAPASETGRPAREADRRLGDTRDDGRDAARTQDDAPRVDASRSAATPAADQAADFAITDADEIGTGGQKTKFRNNVAAIRLLRDLTEQNRPATRDEQATLAKWVGWGGLRAAFPREDGSTAKGWEKEAAELKELLTEAEYKAAEASTRNAHYTSPEVVSAIWNIAKRLGFKGGQVLEPSVGAGNFLGLMPGEVRRGANVTGVELDHITGGIAKHLYPKANIQAPLGFQDLTVPDGWFDLAIGNPPFGSERLYDAERRNLNKFSIHNFFFAKSVDALKPDGVLAMVVTNYFLDASDTRARAYIADRADLVGAIRLPNNAFLKNAGTEVTTDIIVLKKRADGAPAPDRSWVDVGTHTDREGRSVPLNSYFVANPDMMLGDFGAYGTMYRGDEAALVGRDGEDLVGALDAAIRKLPQDIMAEPGVVATETVTVPETAGDAMVGSLFAAPDGSIHVRQPDHLGKPQATAVDFPNDKARERVAGMVRIRDAFARLRRAQIDESATDAAIEALRGDLNAAYDSFVKANGPINAEANRRLFRDDPTWPQISALEEGFDKGVSATVAKNTGEKARPPSAQKAPIFTRRTQQPYQRPTRATSAKDALAQVLADRGRVDLADMARLYGKPEADIVAELGALLYRTPDGAYETADAYLSGNVKKKLAEAERAAADNSEFRRNVAALRDVIPADIEAVDIDVKPGAPWVPANHIEAFVDHIAERAGARAFWSRANAKWQVEGPHASDSADAQWGTNRVTVRAVLDAALNGQTITVRDKLSDGSSVVNHAATDAANDKIERVKAEWKRWLWEDDARREELARLYNDTFNTDVLRRFDGSHLTFPGKVGDDIRAPRPHQKNFVWRGLQTGTILADHTVGAGKTDAAIMLVMEKRRTGQAKKPMVVVPNHLVGQWAADFIKLYPGAKLLAATKKDFEAENRKKLFARIATGDWDAVIVAHSSFGRMGVSPEYEARFIEDQIADLESSMKELREATGEKSRNVSQLAKWRESLQSKLKRLLDAGAKDEGLTFDELGVDMLVVDEAHEFKNLGFATSMQRVGSLGNPQGSQKAADLYMKIQNVLERTGGNNIAFLTGTPLSNTMAEMYTVQRYLDGEALKNLGVSHFDAWARVFGEVVTDWELSPSGQYKLNSRFAKFVNMPELMQRYLSFADVITNDDIKAMLAAQGKRFPLPKVKGGKPQNIVVERSDDQAEFIGTGTTDENGNLQFPKGSLVWRAENLPKKPGKGDDNMLKVMSDARKAALDMRLIDPAYGDTPGSKVHIAADNIKRIYDGWNAQKGTQLVFIDLSTPKKAKAREEARLRDLLRRADEGDEAAQEQVDKMSPDEFMALDSQFSVYDDLKQKLVDRGIPEGEIAFIHDANTDLQKEELFGKVRAGRVRVLFGSTPKMGAGTNVQARLVALHHLDAPWRPSDLEQRDGRGIRQGNTLYEQDPDGFEIEILRYATRNTLDARQWQTIEGKARFIQQMRKGGVKSREIEDIAGEAANAAEMKAAASGNPLILEEMDLRQKLRRLEGQESEHDREQHRIRGRIRSMREERTRIDDRAETATTDAASATELAKADFAATVEGVRHEKNKDFGAAIIAVGRRMLKEGGGETALGSYGPFQLRLEHDHDKAFAVEISGAGSYSVYINDVDEKDPVGLSQQIVNTVRKLADVPDQLRERAAEIDRQVPALEKQVGPWADAAVLEETRARHRDVLDQLRPKQKSPGTPAAESEAGEGGMRASIDGEPVAVLTGTELGVEFAGPQDMPALRRAAGKWYDDNLVGRTVTMRDGTEVRFNKRGRRESTHGGKGDVLLRSVPAIQAILEQGHVVLREPGNRTNVVERVVVVAPVRTGEAVRNLSVSVHLTADGRFQYDFTFDRDAGRPGVGGPGGLTAERPRRSAEEGAPDNLNLVEWHPKDNERATSDVRAELAKGPAAPLIARLEANGRLRLGTSREFNREFFVPPGARALADRSGNIFLIADRIPAGEATAILLHEAFHSGRDGLFEARAWPVLMDRLQKLYRQFEQSSGAARRFFDAAREREQRARDAQGPMSPALRLEEFGAYAIEEYEKAPGAAKRWVDDLVGAVKAWILHRFGRQIGDITPAQLRALAVAALRDRARESAPAVRSAGARGSRFSIAPAAAAPLVRSPDEMVRNLKGKATDWTPALLGAVPLNYFTELKRPNMTAVDDYLKIKRSMDAYRGKKHSAMDEIAQEWRKFARLGWGPLSRKGKARAAQLAELMHEATLAGVDPASNDPEVMKQPAYAALRKRYMALPPSGRDLYNKVRDTYRQQAEETDKILLDNVRKAQKIAEDRAEAQFLEELDRIDRAKMQPSAKKMAIEDAKRAHAAARTKAQWSMKARLTRLRIAFEASRVQPPYFPLARFGRYYALVRDVDGGVLSFSKREKAADRDRLAADLRRAYPTAKIEVGVMDENQNAREAMDPRMVAEIETLVGGAGIDPSTTAALLDSIWQRYLETMPDLSARKRFIHRKGTAGFDADAMRAFAHHMFHAAHQTARLKYGLELQENLNRSVDQARRSDDPTRGVTLTNELKKRHDWVMNPTSAKWSTTINSISFAWMLGATPAAAIVNMTQTPMLGIPILGARLGGMTRASAALAKASLDWVAGRGSVTGANLAHDERRALDAFYESGLIDRSQAHDLAGVGETGVEYSPIRARVMAVISWMYHHAEVWNREVTALAAYRMAKAQGQNETQAIDTAHDLTWKVHFDYSNASRARYLQGDVGKALFVFQSHTLNMTYRMVRDTHQALKGETKQARREARYQLAGILGMMSFLAGGTGVFGYSMVMTLLSAFFGDDDDPMDFEQSVRKAVLEQLGPDVGGMVLKGVPGHLLGIDLTQRIGMPYLWLRPESRELEGRAEFEQLVMRMLGANVGMMANWWHGASIVLKDGQTARGVEMGSPKALKDAMKSFRYLNEGLTSLRGDEVLPADKLSGWDALAQAIGFTPARISETYERNSALKTAEIRVMNRRRELVNRFAMAHRLGDREARDEAMEAIKRFNKVPLNKPVAITTETLRRSLAARERNARRREDGVLIQNERLGRDLREKLPERVY